MDMKLKIKEALNKDKRIREANKWDPDSQPNLYELYNFLRKSGYRLIDVLLDKEGIEEVLIEPVEGGHLYPEIVHDVSDGRFYVKVVDYGLLESSDLEEIVKGYENALGVLKYLDNLDLRELETDKD